MKHGVTLGKRPATHDPRDIQYAAITAGLTAPKADTRNVETFDDWGMLGNDTVGDCVFAGGDHETMLWTQEGGHQAHFTPSTALGDYSAVTGYDPRSPASDQGTDVRTALKYRAAKGLVDVAGRRHKIGAFVALEPGNQAHVKEAVNLFDAVSVGFEVPSYAMDQFSAGKPWAVMSGSQSIEGGHYVPAIGYNASWLYVVTWGRVQRMTWGFFAKFCDEAWLLLQSEFLKAGRSPDGFDLATLKADLAQLGKAA